MRINISNSSLSSHYDRIEGESSWAFKIELVGVIQLNSPAIRMERVPTFRWECATKDARKQARKRSAPLHSLTQFDFVETRHALSLQNQTGGRPNNYNLKTADRSPSTENWFPSA